MLKKGEKVAEKLMKRGKKPNIDVEVKTGVSVVTKHDTFYIDENGEFVNYNSRTKYDPRYCQKLIDYFNIPPYDEKYIFDKKKGKIFVGRVPREMPILSKFCFDMGVSLRFITDWAEKHKEFAEAMNQARDMQEYILVTNSLLGLYTSNVAIFSMKNLIGWKNEQDIFLGGKISIEGLMDQIAQENSNADLLEQKKKGLKLIA